MPHAPSQCVWCMCTEEKRKAGIGESIGTIEGKGRRERGVASAADGVSAFCRDAICLPRMLTLVVVRHRGISAGLDPWWDAVRTLGEMCTLPLMRLHPTLMRTRQWGQRNRQCWA